MTDDTLVLAYRQAQEDLLAAIGRMNPASGFTRYRVQQARAIDAVLVRLGAKTRKWTEKEIARLVRAGSSEMEQEVRKLGETEFSMRFAGVNEDAVRVLTYDASREFGRTMVLMRADASRVAMDRWKLQQEIITGVATGRSVARTQNQLLAQWKEQGVSGMVTRNGFGRRFRPEAYANMLVRTQSMSAYNLGARDQLLAVGRRFALFPKIVPDIDGDDVCNRWEERKYVDLLKDALPPQSTHPNCRHRILPVPFAELKAERPDLYRLALEYHREATR